MKQQKEIINIIKAERMNQDRKFGAMPRNRAPSVYLAILTEEIGEVARAILEGDSNNYREELIQVAAVALMALEDYYSGIPELEIKDTCEHIAYRSEINIKCR